MQYRLFPATGDSLSVLGFGAMGFAGWFGPIDDNDGIRSLHTALELGVNVIDTARAYGRSEQVVGAALRALVRAAAVRRHEDPAARPAAPVRRASGRSRRSSPRAG